jgi:hypothetical protein
MVMVGRWFGVAVLGVALGFVAPEVAAQSFSGAGGTASEAPRFAPEKIVAFAKKVEKTIAARGARVALVARIGRPPGEMPPGMRYTHVGFAVYSQITMKDGR